MRYLIALTILSLGSFGLAERPRSKNSSILEGTLVIRAINKDTDGEFLSISQGGKEKTVEYFIKRGKLTETYLNILDSLSGGEKCTVRGVIDSSSRSILVDFVEVGNTGSEQLISHTGSVFVRDRTKKELGDAWRDESGLIWGDVVPAEDLPDRPGMTHHSTAYRYCRSIGARLPTVADFIRLREYFGAKETADPSQKPEGYQSQLFPNFQTTKDWTGKLEVPYEFWTDKALDIDGKILVEEKDLGTENLAGKQAFVFNVVTGEIRIVPSHFKWARCVLQAQP